MFSEERVRSQRFLLLKLLDLTRGLHVALDRLEEEVESHRACDNGRTIAAPDGAVDTDPQKAFSGREPGGLLSMPGTISAGTPAHPEATEAGADPGSVHSPGFSMEVEAVQDAGQTGEWDEATVENLAREHASVMEALIEGELDQTPELLDLALEAREKVREMMARLDACRDRTLEVMASHARQRSGAAAYASQAMAPGR